MDGGIGGADDLRALYGAPSDKAVRKQLARIDTHARNFIALSPFLVLGTSGPDGADCSPRGDAPGFVAVIDEHTLLIPDRLGNNRIDSLTNVSVNPNVGLIFFVPGINETLRVNGKATVTVDQALLAPLAVQERAPRSGLLVKVEQMYFHCAKALIRSKLWDSDTRVERKSFPTLGRILADQIADCDAAESEAFIAESYKTRLY
ncbi:PPOX class probable FMN-dependent enzyme [Constrictibacter sp. MBR-5]|jgi:PPOX class probable FMN-dependent enzyme|uniref:pyridoxamine 5'-phosphate oxidase family protein n=1 Tax=Constrictibacter sp. MBR-5 TaxID=3156467 RepID=UPI00339587BE